MAIDTVDGNTDTSGVGDGIVDAANAFAAVVEQIAIKQLEGGAIKAEANTVKQMTGGLQ